MNAQSAMGVRDLSACRGPLDTTAVLCQRREDRASYDEEQHSHGNGYCAEGDQCLDSQVIVHAAQRTGGAS